MMRKEKKSKKWYVISAAAGILILIFIFLATLKIENVVYEGNERLSDEELTDRIFGGSYDKNPFVFLAKSLFGDKEEIPFVEEYDIEMESLTSIRVTVYEKSIVGYISYMDTYMYFDKDGIVVENSVSSYEDVPEITGIRFDNIILHSRIPAKNESIFSLILDVTQLVDKYDIAVKRINISDVMEVTLYIGNFRVAMGNGGEYGEKVSALADMLPKIQDIPGELNMKEVSTNGSGYVFKKE